MSSEAVIMRISMYLKMSRLHRLPPRYRDWGRWSHPPLIGGCLFLHESHDIERSQTIEGNGLLSCFQPIKCWSLYICKEMSILTAALMCFTTVATFSLQLKKNMFMCAVLQNTELIVMHEWLLIIDKLVFSINTLETIHQCGAFFFHKDVMKNKSYKHDTCWLCIS